MKVSVVLLLVSLALCSVVAEQGKRLIQTSETEKKWMTEEEVLALAVKPHHNFMDVTDYDATYEALKTLAPKAQTPIPITPAHVPYVKEQLLPYASARSIEHHITELSNFFTRYCRSDTGVQASEWVLHKFEEYSFHRRHEISVSRFTSSDYPQISAIGTIHGHGPNKDSRVIIGGHLDSIVSPNTARSPGADDDGSGTASVLEIFRVLASHDYRPDYTLEFIGYAAEEIGLLGSQAIAQDYLKNGIDVYAVMQLDMTGYQWDHIATIMDYTSGELNTFVQTLIGTYTTLTYVEAKCGYACSDHASWNRTGVRSSFPFEAPLGNTNPYIHTVNDTLSNLSPAQMLQFVYLGIGFAVELAGVAA